MTRSKLGRADPPSKGAWWWPHFLERVTREAAPECPTLADVTRARALELHDVLGWELEAVLADAERPEVASRVAALYREALGRLEDDDPQASLVRYLVENALAFQHVYRGRSRAELEAAGATVEASARSILARVSAELCLDDMTEQDAATVVPWIVEAIRPRLGGRGNRDAGPTREHARHEVRAKLAALAPDLALFRTEHSADAKRPRRVVKHLG